MILKKIYILYNDGTKEHNGAIILNYIWEIIKKIFWIEKLFLLIYHQGVSKHNGKWNKNLSKILQGDSYSNGWVLLTF